MVREERSGTTVALVATLDGCSEATLTLTAELTNTSTSVPLPLTLDLSVPRGKTPYRWTLAVLRRIDGKAPWRYRWHYDWKLGARLEGAPRSHRYELPFRSGPFKLSQGPLGRFSHGPGSQDEQAYDFLMPEGTEVTAAREGTVVGVRMDCTEGGPEPRFQRDFNYVVVRHEDGTYAEYIHLAPGSARVRVGERVTPQTVLALSGNTGYSTEPHLHLAVFNTLDGRTRATWAIQFRARSGGTLELQEGNRY